MGSPSGRRYLRVGVEVEALSGGLGGVDGHEGSCQLEAWDGGELRRFDPGLGKRKLHDDTVGVEVPYVDCREEAELGCVVKDIELLPKQSSHVNVPNAGKQQPRTVVVVVASRSTR